MSTASVIFFSIFVLPLLGLLFWIMRQDKRKGLLGIVIVVILATAAIAAVYNLSQSYYPESAVGK